MANRRDVKRRGERPPVESPFTVIVDTREQLGYRFESVRADRSTDPLQRPISIPYVRRFLSQGDYSIVGYETAVAIERKSISDLFGTLGSGRRRFESELSRLQVTCQFAAVVVESEWSEILSGPPTWSKLNPKTVFRSVLAWQQRFPRVHWHLMPGRTAAEITTYRILERFWFERERQRSTTIHECQTA